MQNDSKSHSQAIHVLKSHLNALKIDFSTDSTSADLVVKGTKGDVPVILVEGKTSVEGSKISINVEDIVAPQLDKVLGAIHVLTEFAGFGRPIPVDRGPAKKGRVTYHDQYEDVIFRHQLLRRSPNPEQKELERYLPVIKRVVYGIMRQFKPVFGAMGMDEGDLVSIAMVHTISFIHNYAYESESKNSKLLTEFLVQRLGEVAKITFHKAYDCSCLPQSVKKSLSTNPDWSDDDLFARALGTYESQEAPPADEGYEEGSYILEVEGKRYNLESVADGLLGIKVYIDGKELDAAGLRWLGAAINGGAKLMVKEEPVKAEPVKEEPVAKKPLTEEEEYLLLSPRDKIYKKLDSMTAENREWLLTYAALSRDFCDEARNMARKLCEELICPKCSERLSNTSSCRTCNIDGVPRYGIDYMAVREKLYKANDPVVAVLNAPISEATARLKKKARKAAEAPKLSDDEKVVEAANKRQDTYDELPATLTCPKIKCQQSNPKALFTRSDDVTSSNLTCPACGHSDHQYEFWAKQKQVEFFNSQPDIWNCANPECGKDKHKSEFGVRVPRLSTSDKRPLSACRMARCKPCRRKGTYGNH